MRRFLTAVLLTVTVLALSALPALATPISELTDLARFFPAQTPIFASARIDDAFFETLDGVVAKVGAALPAGAIPPMTIVQALDMALADATPPMQFQADILGVPVSRPRRVTTQALGAAYLAGLAVGYWSGPAQLDAQWQESRRLVPAMRSQDVQRLTDGWARALDAVTAWAR